MRREKLQIFRTQKLFRVRVSCSCTSLYYALVKTVYVYEPQWLLACVVIKSTLLRHYNVGTCADVWPLCPLSSYSCQLRCSEGCSSESLLAGLRCTQNVNPVTLLQVTVRFISIYLKLVAEYSLPRRTNKQLKLILQKYELFSTDHENNYYWLS